MTLPLPEPGEVIETEFPRYGLTVLVQRRPQETEEQVRARFVVVAPTGDDNRTHTARLGAGVQKPKRMGVTLCTESQSSQKRSGTRIDGLTLESVTCPRCRAALRAEGVELPDLKGNGS